MRSSHMYKKTENTKIEFKMYISSLDYQYMLQLYMSKFNIYMYFVFTSSNIII